MPISSTPDLTPIERAAISAEGAARNFKGTPEEFTVFYKWGEKDLESCVEAFVNAGTQSFSELGKALFVAINTDPEKAARLNALIAEAREIVGLT